MTFPTVETVGHSHEASNTTSHTVTLPASIVSGDLLIVQFAEDGNDAVTWPGGWTELDAGAGNGSQARQEVRFRRADGGEGATIALTTAGAQQSVHRSYRISGHHITTDPEAAGASSVSGSDPDPPNLAPSWGAEDTLWIAFCGGNSDRTIVTYPTGYNNNQHFDSSSGSGGCCHGAADKDDNTASDNPSIFDINTNTSWRAATVAIRPTAISAVVKDIIMSGIIPSPR